MPNVFGRLKVPKPGGGEDVRVRRGFASSQLEFQISFIKEMAYALLRHETLARDYPTIELRFLRISRIFRGTLN